GREAQALPQADDGVDEDAGRPAERAAVERLRRLRPAPPAQEARAVGLPLDGPLRPALLADDVDGPDRRVLRRPGAPPAEQRARLGDVLRLDEELAERGVREVVGVRREHDL